MNKFSMKKLLSILLCIALIAALALSTVGCSKNDNTAPATTAEASGVVSMGEGETSFLFNVVDPEGKESHFEIHTDEKTVGAAAAVLGSDCGRGQRLRPVRQDRQRLSPWTMMPDGKYWAFYVDGEYAATGVDSTDITAGATYTFKAE